MPTTIQVSGLASSATVKDQAPLAAARNPVRSAARPPVIADQPEEARPLSPPDAARFHCTQREV